MLMVSLKFIPTKIHGYIDYVTATLMSTSPFYVKGIKNENYEGLSETGVRKIDAEQIVPYSLGVLSSAYSLFTNYELGAVKKIPMKVHLKVDALNGAFLALSPFIFKFYKKTWMPFVAVGVMEILVALFTKTNRQAETYLV